MLIELAAICFGAAAFASALRTPVKERRNARKKKAFAVLFLAAFVPFAALLLAPFDPVAAARAEWYQSIYRNLHYCSTLYHFTKGGQYFASAVYLLFMLSAVFFAAMVGISRMEGE